LAVDLMTNTLQALETLTGTVHISLNANVNPCLTYLSLFLWLLFASKFWF